jgi:hypothetical protein
MTISGIKVCVFLILTVINDNLMKLEGSLGNVPQKFKTTLPSDPPDFIKVL